VPRLTFYATILLWGATTCALAETPVAQKIRQLVPHATAMKRADFQRITRSTSAPKPSDFTSHSLTAMLLSLKVDPNPSDRQKREFQYLGEGYPEPVRLASELRRPVGKGISSFLPGPVTFIHADRIKKVTVKLNDDVARGKIVFEVPKLYRGETRYKAIRKDGKWQITEFAMPSYDLRIARQDGGTWRKVER
jgi:hypothetical protein